jgi:hypothetical protein
MSYKIILTYLNLEQRKTTLHTGLTLIEAQNICEDRESSWQSCTKKYLKERTRKRGPWFLVYTKE